MSSKDSKQKFCNLYSFVKKDASLVALIDDLCAEGLFKGKGEKTFLNPSKSLIKKIQDMIDNGDADNALTKLKSLFLEGYHETISKSGSYVSFNGKKVTGLEATKCTSFNKWNSDINVFDVTEFPQEGEATASTKPKKSGKGITGGKELALRVDATNTLINHYMSDKDHKQFAYAVNSLLKFVKSKDSKVYESIHKLLDPNMVLSWYILVQPSAKSGSKYISDSLFSKWYKDLFKSPIKSVELIRELMSSNNYDNKDLKNIIEKRKEIKAIGLKDTINDVEKAYKNNYGKLLEDEIRFRFSDLSEFDGEDIMALNLIDWDSPKKSLVLFNYIPKSNLLQSEIYKLITQFIKSNAFLYTPYNDDIMKKIKNTISGAGSGSNSSLYICGGSNRDTVQQMPTCGSLEFSLENFVGGLNAEQIDELKSYL
jgi:hypothetical protein